DHYWPGFPLIGNPAGIKIVFPFDSLTVAGNPGSVSPDVQADPRFIGRGIVGSAQVAGGSPERVPPPLGNKKIFSPEAGVPVAGKKQAAIVQMKEGHGLISGGIDLGTQIPGGLP